MIIMINLRTSFQNVNELGQLLESYKIHLIKKNNEYAYNQ